ncbi:MAG: hypothetical protein NT023_23390 [Armatimonadetes bacterium]|nr:hypothetical protein [Armatimonadota bacterium]
MAIYTKSEPQVLEGTWSDVRPYIENIPAESHVHLVITPPISEDADEQARLQKVFAEFLDEVDALEFAPPSEPLPATTAAVLEKFRRKGLRA